jgi:hypothetical protein
VSGASSITTLKQSDGSGSQTDASVLRTNSKRFVSIMPSVRKAGILWSNLFTGGHDEPVGAPLG